MRDLGKLQNMVECSVEDTGETIHEFRLLLDSQE